MKKQGFLMIFFLSFTFGFTQHHGFNKSPNEFGWQNVGYPGVLVTNTYYNQIAFDTVNNLPCIAFSDFSAYTGKATVMESNGSIWWFYGNYDFSAGEADFVSLAIGPQNYPYVAFQDWGNSNKATVMKCPGVGGTWVNAGNAGFSDGPAYYTSLAFNPANGMPYIAYSDDSHNKKITVKKFDGNSWIDVGNQSFSTGVAKYIDMTFSPMNEPYVVFEDLGHNQKASVMKFNGTDWVYVGNPGISPGQAEYTCIAFNPVDHLPYIVFEDFSNDNKVTAMKFDGTGWTYAGSPGFSGGNSEYLSLSISKTGLLYVSFRDYAQLNTVSVMNFNGTAWSYVGVPGFSIGESEFIDLALDKDGVPYVTFKLFSGPYPSATVMKYDSVLVGLREHEAADLIVSPNPAGSDLCIELQDQNTRLTEVKVFNLSGGKICTYKVSGNKCKLNVSDLSSGIYFVEVHTSENVYFKKILKI